MNKTDFFVKNIEITKYTIKNIGKQYFLWYIYLRYIYSRENTLRKNALKEEKKMLAAISAVEDDDERRIVGQWYKKYYGFLYRKAYSIVKKSDLAEDMVNEAFIKIIKNFKTIVKLNANKRTAYFAGTIKSVALDYIRKKQTEIGTLDEDFETVMEYNVVQDNKIKTPEQLFITKENLEVVTKAMEKLNEKEAMLIIEKYYFEKTDKEIGELLGIKHKHVHVYVKRVCKKLLNYINEE